MKYKIGDKVRVRKDLVPDNEYGGQMKCYDVYKYLKEKGEI